MEKLYQVGQIEEILRKDAEKALQEMMSYPDFPMLSASLRDDPYRKIGLKEDPRLEVIQTYLRKMAALDWCEARCQEVIKFGRIIGWRRGARSCVNPGGSPTSGSAACTSWDIRPSATGVMSIAEATPQARVWVNLPPLIFDSLQDLIHCLGVGDCRAIYFIAFCCILSVALIKRIEDNFIESEIGNLDLYGTKSVKDTVWIKAGLSFKEARAVLAYLMPRIWPTNGELHRSVYNLSRKGFEKIGKSGHDIREIIPEERLLRF